MTDEQRLQLVRQLDLHRRVLADLYERIGCRLEFGWDGVSAYVHFAGADLAEGPAPALDCARFIMGQGL